jgi:hypothetical protein
MRRPDVHKRDRFRKDGRDMGRMKMDLLIDNTSFMKKVSVWHIVCNILRPG